jgi:hypothetical protein
MSMGVGFMPMEMDVTLDDLRFIENTINIIFSVEWVPTPHALVLPELLRPSQPLSSPIHACGVCVCVCVCVCTWRRCCVHFPSCEFGASSGRGSGRRARKRHVGVSDSAWHLTGCRFRGSPTHLFALDGGRHA